jgi:hypothetical protein
MRKVTCAALLVVGCSSEPADIGRDRGESRSDYAGIWDGYTEAYEVEPGSSRIRLVLDEAGRGTVRFGDGPLLPPPDPTVGYPPNLPPSAFRETHVGGFEYPMHDAAVHDRRLTFSVKVYDHFTDWCRAQTPVLVADHYACVPNWATSWGTTTECAAACCVRLSHEGGGETWDCLRYNLCLYGVCRCTADKCEVFTELFPNATHFDATLQAGGNEIIGSMSIVTNGASAGELIPTKGVVAVRLTRQ